jgi:hypothetical protein
MANADVFAGKWALVTGASAGIGAALARELARRGAKLVLTARRRERLEVLAAELATQGTETRIIVADLADPAAPQQIFDAAGDLTVEILINNAGLGQYGAFCANDADQDARQVRVNCEAVVRLSRFFVPSMVERQRGWVLVVASTASFQPLPYLAVYAATKAFDRYFALGLAAEVARLGVKVTALCPGTTESEFFEVARASHFRSRGLQPTAEVARLAIDALARGRRIILPKPSNRWQTALVRFLPVNWVTSFVEKAARPPES